MNWIKQNTFLFGLAIATVVGALVLWLLGSAAAGRYEDSKTEYDQALADTRRFESLDLYPKQEHLDSKKLAIQAYREEAEELQKAFEAYRPESLENITVQAFSNAVTAANDETRAAFADDVVVPENYFCGFEAYRAGSPPGNATGILNYQLAVLKQLMLKLAQAEATSLVSIHRPRLAEEEGKAFKAEKGQIARKLPLEIVFEGNEPSVRAFLSSLVNDKDHYLVVRSWRIVNKKELPPRKTDARFEGSSPRNTGAGAADNSPNFSELFNGGADGAKPEGEAQPAPEEPAPAPAPAPIPGDSSRILAQVLGQEELEVFVRLDLLLFLEPKELP